MTEAHKGHLVGLWSHEHGLGRREEMVPYLPAWDLTTSNVFKAAWAIVSSSSGNILSSGKNWSLGSRKQMAPVDLCALAETSDNLIFKRCIQHMQKSKNEFEFYLAAFKCL